MNKHRASSSGEAGGLRLAEPGGPSPHPSRWRGCSRRGLAALSLSLIAVVVAYLVPGAPDAFLGTAVGLALFSLVILASGAALLSRLVERRRGRQLVSEALTVVNRVKSRFEVAWFTALVGLGLIAVLAGVLDEASDLFLRGWFLLLIGGGAIGLAASLAANLLLVLPPRAR